MLIMLMNINIENQAVPENRDNVPIENDNVDNQIDAENGDDNLNNSFYNESDDLEDNRIDNVEQEQENPFDIFDPRMWDALDSKRIELLVTKGPKRDLSIVNGPKDELSRRFTANLYTRVLSNGEKCDRDWLVYSKQLDRVFCFCCKVFKIGNRRGQLTNEGCSD
ncbi:hypothetical protein RND71_013693 [Anisodus tanguticus]|uniref:TTF-type domain-containing protein n=1 Tax=Anisodus tanguticus TaxID=243964 RepID=A0AAE1VDJ4_9SOLA|nr:hypothetical protein RND71_013693 [Anisodus tanguticus]